MLPLDAFLLPFDNGMEKANPWYTIKSKSHLPAKLPCPDNCGLSINWHVNSDYKIGWTTRIKLFNWDEFSFYDWFAAIQFPGYENVYSFNNIKLPQPKNTILMQELLDLNYLVGEVNGINHVIDP
ncbi:unnamed protein product [Fraxinus pennsylvanica]|uniref:COBRA C-terminal domain-containing protein n=1 Tax=Fraxinus pennsylvanica TaxID=56036 RepID=A0AAD2DLW5_9LAMI|nr:unnamed protein product [Fraxinus pennsylvanica]